MCVLKRRPREIQSEHISIRNRCLSSKVFAPKVCEIRSRFMFPSAREQRRTSVRKRHAVSEPACYKKREGAGVWVEGLSVAWSRL